MNNAALDDLILNTDFTLAEDEQIVWSGKPKSYFSISLFDYFKRDSSGSFLTLLQFIFLFTIFILIYNLPLNINYSKLVTWIIGFAFILLIPEVIKNYRKQQTQYYLTNQRVIIKTWRLGFAKTLILRLKNIDEVSYVGEKDNTGTLYLKSKTPLNVKTYDFHTGARRHYPTLELIYNYMQVKEKIETAKKKSI